MKPIALDDLDRDELLALIRRDLFVRSDERDLRGARWEVASARVVAASEVVRKTSDARSAAHDAYHAAKAVRQRNRAYLRYLEAIQDDDRAQRKWQRLGQAADRAWAEYMACTKGES